MNPEIVILGSCSVDFTSYAPRLPLKGETLHGTKFLTSYGGKGANQCVAAAKLGAKTALIARMGDDKWGNDYKSYLDSEGVDVTYTNITANKCTGIAQITVSDSGDNQIVIVAGANGCLNNEDVENAKNYISNCKILVCQYETPVATTIAALKMCKSVSIFNAAPASADMSDELLSLPTIFCVNETEASIITGYEIKTLNDTIVAIGVFLNHGCQCVVITMGGEGAVVASQENPKPIHISTKNVAVVDTTGAGDAFIGALAYLTAMTPDSPLQERIAKACLAATYSVQFEGTQTSYIKNVSELENTTNWKYL